MADAVSTRVESSAISVDELRKLVALREAGSPGDWYIARGLMADTLWITTHLREMSIRGDPEGSIGSVSKSRTVRDKSNFNDRHSFREVPHKRAADDAALICAAVNSVAKMAAALLAGKQAEETAWLIEWPASKHNPIRYFSVGEQPVMNASDATRFARKIDAENWLHRDKLGGGARAVEHMWMS